jgi:hypothetical protein
MRAAQFVKTELTENSLQEIDRRGFLKGAGAAAVAGAAGGTKAGGIGLSTIIPVYTDSDPPLPRTVKWAWNYFSPDVLTQDDKNNIVKLINLLYFAKMAPEEWRDSQNGRIIGNATPSQIYKKCHELLIFINDAFVNLDFPKVMNIQKDKLENLYKNDPAQFRKLQEFFFSKWETTVLLGKLLEKRLTKKDQQVEPDQEQKRKENLQRMQRNAAGPSRTYADQITRRIKPNLTYTGDIDGNPRAEVEIRSAPDGTILSRRIVQSSGNAEWDKSVLRAIDKSVSLPKDTDGYVPPVLVISFKPKDLDESELDEGWKETLGAATLAGAMALGSAGANARVTPDGQGGYTGGFKPAATTTSPAADVKPAAPASQSFSKEYLQKAADPNRTGRYMISVEKAQELLSNMQEGSDKGQKIGNMDADDFDDAMSRLKKLAGAGPMRTVYDPDRRVYRNMPTAQQPAQQPKKAPQ